MNNEELVGVMYGFDFDGIDITVTVDDRRKNDDGSTSFWFTYKFRDRKKQTTLTDYGPPSQYEQTVKKHAAENARQFAREVKGSGQAPINFIAIQFLMGNRSDWSAICIASASVDLPITLVQEGFRNLVSASPTGRQISFVSAHGRNVVEDIFLVTVNCLGCELITEVIFVEMGLPCQIGTQLADQLVKQQPKHYYTLYGSHLRRAIGEASRAKESTILLLGSYSATANNDLETIQEELFSLGYQGVLLKDFDDIPEQTLEEKLLMLASLSKGVMFIDDDPSGHLVEISICTRAGFSIALINTSAEHLWSTAMIADLEMRFKNFRIWNEEQITRDSLDAVLRWFEDNRQERANILNGLYRWRSS